MKHILGKFKNEKGSLSIEFLGILPFLFLFILILWQVVASGAAILSTQSAVNEAAKVYALTQEYDEAVDTAVEMVGSGDIATFQGLSIPPEDSDGTFSATINISLRLLFLPDELTVPFSITTTSRVLDYE